MLLPALLDAELYSFEKSGVSPKVLRITSRNEWPAACYLLARVTGIKSN